jgi:type I restriction enzyme, R subunit
MGQKASAWSQVKLAIEEVLNPGPPSAYSPDLYQQKYSALFEHLYETYGDRGASIYR